MFRGTESGVKRGEEIMGIADPRLNLDVEYHCGRLSRQRGGRGSDCFVLKVLMRSSTIIYQKRGGVVVDVKAERAMFWKLNRFSTSTCLKLLPTKLLLKYTS